jgi:hypothetical protein
MSIMMDPRVLNPVAMLNPMIKIILLIIIFNLFI